MIKHITTLLIASCLFICMGQAEPTQQPVIHARTSKGTLAAKDPVQAQQVVNTPRPESKTHLSFATDSIALVRTPVLEKGQGQTSLQRANLLWQNGEVEAALSILQDTEQILTKNEEGVLLLQVFEMFAVIYEQEENYTDALAYRKRQVQLQQELYSGHSQIEQVGIPAEEVAKIHILKKETALRSRQLGLAILGGSIVFVFALLLYQQSLQNRRLAEELELRVQQRTKDLEDSNQALQRFAYIASHDLKTPLRTIVSLLSLIRKKIQGLKDLELEELMKMTSAGATRMTSMIESLLTFARVNSSIQPIEYQEIKLETIVENVRENLGNIDINKPLRILNSSLPIVNGNSVKLYQLFQNLITNGLKYNASEQPTVKIVAKPYSKDFHIVQVSDNGIGIEEEFRECVFEMFTRLHSSRDYEGTGIGLALSKLIVEQHGGKIWIEDNASGGTTFCFTLPIVK